ncbi:histidinol dehydrogenase [Spelaeicoccus albus]|uniref:Histidinol dehydrogenase n=2 Tax=Spelaeicoccus albus TaxID=1280376 RepID=A0A7Z0D3E3_9MICO|nr:histidinol dehydrogenase [Spelaeicoccus albus]NYI68144.1 histidinol dehydrogenase [Spelaeicoccus albus]
MRRLDLSGSTLDRRTLRAVMPRAGSDVFAATTAVKPMLEEIRHRGLAAIAEYTARFDGPAPAEPRVPDALLKEALDALDADVRDALRESIRRARIVHEAQRRDDVTVSVEPGAQVTERWLPVERVGLYVPGGLAVYPSSVIMNVVPAQVAGVESLAIASPPQREFGGYPHPTILAAAELLGVRDVYAIGGAQAVAAFAYGYDATADAAALDPVDLITGPGNAYVAAAKNAVRDLVGIDAIAGPTEIAVIADDSADPDYVAADLISQAEHDPQASSVLVTASAGLADAVEAAVERRVPRTKHVDRVTAALGGPQSAIVTVDTPDAAIAVINAYAGEHVEVHTVDATDVAARIVNAGAVFIGSHSPVSLGDYCAGSNHVLPTSGTATHESGLSVQSFLKGTHLIEYSPEALRTVARHVVTLAEAEDLPAHGEAVTARMEN